MGADAELLLTPCGPNLDEARTQGRVGETLNGYLRLLKNDAETQKLVLDIIMPAAPVISVGRIAIIFPWTRWRRWQAKLVERQSR